MLRHYQEVKARYPDGILLYRMGDFFELFFEDAVTAAPVLQVTLTSRHKGSPNEVPMCGVPHHALQTYLARLVNAGFRAVICDQVEDPAEAKGLVRREVTSVVTPGTASQPGLLESTEANLLACVVLGQAPWRAASSTRSCRSAASPLATAGRPRAPRRPRGGRLLPQLGPGGRPLRVPGRCCPSASRRWRSGPRRRRISV